MGRSLSDRSGKHRDPGTGYESEFGSKGSFEKGFEMGLNAGYNDGYLGRSFRAVSAFRALAPGITQNFPPTDPHSAYFDQGFVAGYKDASLLPPATLKAISLDPPSATCGEFRPMKPEDAVAQGSFCEGYLRGLILGRDDAALSPPAVRPLQARR